MAHITKFQKHALGHMLKHFRRALDEKGEPIKYGNKNIDLTRSHLNYNLAPRRENQYGFIMDRCRQVYCLSRKDVNLMCSCIVTAPKDLPTEDNEKFFRVTYDFLSKRYGGEDHENVVSAYVHMDEGTPHIHFAFVPICYDKTKRRFTVSAKNVVNRKDLKTLHPDLERYVTKEIGRPVHIITGELSKRSNLTLEQHGVYKETLKQLEKVQNMLRDAESALKGTERTIELKKGEVDELKSVLKSYEKQVEHQRKIYEVFGGDPTLLDHYKLESEERQEESVDFEELISRF